MSVRKSRQETFISAPNIPHFMSKLLQRLVGQERNVFVHQDPHGASATSCNGVTCSSASVAA